MLRFKIRRPFLLLSALFAGLLTAACDDGMSPGSANQDGPATIRILLTDAPHPAIGEALVAIGRVEIIPAGGGGPIVLSEDGTDGFVNLLDLQGPATLPIAEAEIEPGSFSQLRLFVDSARVVLAEGDYYFRDGTKVKDLTVPSGAQTGIKLILHSGDEEGPLQITPGETVLVLDFDVGESFVMLGNPDTPAGIHGVNFKPTIRVTGYDVAASISGTVTTEAGLEGENVGLTVRAVPTNGGTVAGYQSETGTAVTDENGAYTIHYLVPGDYEVSVDLEPGLGTIPESQPVTLDNSEDETGIDFVITDLKGSISGTVSTQLNGVSVVGLPVIATPDAEGQDPLETETIAGGVYSFESVIPGGYTVTVTVGDGQTTTPPSAEFELTNNEEKTGVNFAVVAAS